MAKLAHRRSQERAVGAPPGRRKKIRRNLQGTFVSAPPDRASHLRDIFLLAGGDLEGRRDSLSSFRLCFEGDD